MSRNRLDEETSPYLLQHQSNPVHWRPWGEAALAAAQQDNKPILLSIGYSACHWCHVMAHESFEDATIAGVMNDLFINIKVDREERPDLDVIYQSALALMGEQGGWPLTMFLTPKGEPFWGGTYFPATPRYGRPAFPDLLKQLSNSYDTQKERIAESVGALKTALEQLSKPAGGPGLSFALLDEAAALAENVTDPIWGGTQGAPKFPQASFFQYLWRSSIRTGNQGYARSVTLLLERMCQGGIYDHIGGGFARYSTDEVWLAPHFEKMLYDNAQLIELMADVWRVTRDPLLEVRTCETIDWCLREMLVNDESGNGFAFASALDADAEGEEGRFTVWSAQEIDDVLGEDSEPFKAAYDVTPGGNWEGKNILNRNASDATRKLGNPDKEALLKACRAALLKVRDKRVWPERDHKALVDWNAMMVAALAHSGSIFDRKDWIECAQTVFDFVCHNMTETGRFRHSWRDGKPRHTAVLDDYAQMIRAALCLYEATGKLVYMDQAEAWMAIVYARYWDETGGGYFLSADDTTDVITRSKTIADNAVPSGNGVMTEVLARLYLLNGNEEYRTRAEKMILTFSSSQARNMVSLSGLMMGYEVLERALSIVIVGTAGDPETDALIRAAIIAAPPWRVIHRLKPGTDLPQGHPAYGKTATDKPAAFVCTAGTCGLPITSAEGLRDHLTRL
ncbi:MAG: thioredoxin domain-containing protein [Rhodospirillales bacterium]|nr:thioredoxin domain-containing protein [Rhodospirillales bacterium]